MAVYYTMLLGLSLCGALLCVKNRTRRKDGCYLLISFLVLAGVSAIRYDVGYDYSYIYAPAYESYLQDTTGEVFANHRFEPGFKLLIKVLMMFSRNYHMLFVVTSIITVALVMLYYWLYSPNPFISVFLFVVLSQLYCSMDFIRQMIAASIAMFAFPMLKRRNIWGSIGYFAIVILAATFHKSALLLIPFFFINLIPSNKFVLAAYAAVTVAIYFNTERIVDFVTRYWYSGYSLNSQHMKVGFVPHFAIALGIIFLIIFFSSNLLKEQGKHSYLYVNYAFFTFFFAFMGTRHSILDRLSMPFAMLTPVALAAVVHGLSIKLKEQPMAANVKRYANKYSMALAGVLALIVFGGLAIHHYALYMDGHGVSRYRVIFAQPFYKEYVEQLKAEKENAQYIIDGEEPIEQPEDIEENYRRSPHPTVLPIRLPYRSYPNPSLRTEAQQRLP